MISQTRTCKGCTNSVAAGNPKKDRGWDAFVGMNFEVIKESIQENRKGVAMLRSSKSLEGYSLNATDGEIGKVSGFLFDDRFWRTRYLVVDVGSWLVRQQVLISPVAVELPLEGAFPTNLTKEQIEHSPDIDTSQPVSREREHHLNRYYGWPLYWSSASFVGSEPIMPPPVMTDPERSEEEAGDQQQDESNGNHLRSTREVEQYALKASDGQFGHIADFILDEESWKIRYIVADTGKWFHHGRKVLVAPEWTESIDWATQTLSISVSKSQVENSPTYDPTAPVNREYEEVLYDYYGRPKYWTEP